MNTDRSQVQAANLRFYESTAQHYERVDPRRKASKGHEWLDASLSELYRECKEAIPSLLDAGAGTGYASLRAVEKFSVTALDMSPSMLEQIKDSRIKKIQASCEEIPLSDQSMNAVIAIATLHHLHDPSEFFKEAFRILKPGGILYTDHDIEQRFVRNFSWPLKIYRSLFDHGKFYLKEYPQLKAKDLELCEFHGSRGIDAVSSKNTILQLGFSRANIECHWEGMSPLPWNVRGRGISPLLRIWAIK